MKTLITGSTGFIGRHLVKALLEKNREVRCLARHESKMGNLIRNGAEVVFGDLHDKDSLRKAVKGARVVYHLAGEVYTRRSNDFFKTNAEGTANLLDACLSEDIKKFVHLSSIASVGPTPNRSTLLTEETPYNPITSYGRSKCEGERIALDYYRKFGLPVVSVSPPIVYGPGQPAILNNFFERVHRGSILVIGDGNCQRSLCYIDNLIHALILAEEKKEAEGKVFLIADEDVYTFNEILSVLAEEEETELRRRYVGEWVGHLSLAAFIFLEKTFKLSFMNLYAMSTMILNFGCDISKAKKELGYIPKINLREGMKRTINSLKTLAC